MFQFRSFLLLLLISAPNALTGQSFAPPAQAYVLQFRDPGIAYTSQINLGAAFTMECWISLDEASPYRIIMGKVYNPPAANEGHYLIQLDGPTGLIPVFVQSTGQSGSSLQIKAPAPLALHTWTHLAAVLDSGTMRLYVNGQQVGSGPSPGPPANTSVPFSVGSGAPNPQGLTIDGVLREARVWSRALSASELQTYARQKLTGAEPGLIANWPLGDGTGLVAQDAGPQHLSLVLQDKAAWIRTAYYDAGPYWEYQRFNYPGAVGFGQGTTVDLGGSLTALFALQQSVTLAGSPRAFRWNSSAMADVTATVLPIPVEENQVGDFAVADFSGDGRLDVFIFDAGIDLFPSSGGQSHLLVQSADGQLVDETTSRLPVGKEYPHSGASADIDGDGDIDIYMGNLCCAQNPDGSALGPRLYINDGTGHFTPRTAGLPDFVWHVTWLMGEERFTSSRFLDVNNDGFPDLVLGGDGSTSRNVLLLNDGHGNFTPAAASVLPPKVGGIGWTTVAIAPADYDGDGFTDLILDMTQGYHLGVALQFLVNNGDGTFHDGSAQIPQNFPPPPGPDDYWIAKVVPCDINGDGWIDFLTTGSPTLPPRLYINQGHGVFIDLSDVLPTKSLSHVLCGDFDGDGRRDLFFPILDGGNPYGFARNLKPILPASTPVTSHLSPSTAVQGSSVSAAVTGKALTGATSVTFSGVGVTAVIGSGGTDTNLPITVTVAKSAAPGTRAIFVTSPAGTSAAFSGFTVKKSPRGQVTSQN